MRNQNRNRQTCFIASVTDSVDDYGTPIYDVPFAFKENTKPLSGTDDIVEFGERVTKMYLSTPQLKRWKGKIKEGDVAYLEGASPFSEPKNGVLSNFNVVSVRYSLSTMSIYFEKKS